VRSAQNRVDISLLQATLLASLVNLSRTAGNIAGFNTASLELGSTVSEGRSLDGVQELSALCGLVGDVVSWMG
jgi:hypothetical protein